ncbi:MAG: asparagine--tRNA ligase [archaeon]
MDISEILAGKHDSQRVRIRGWVHGNRSSGGVQFLQVRDGTGVLQCVLKRDALDQQQFSKAEMVVRESTLELEGSVRVDPRAPRGYELQVSQIAVLHKPTEDFPIANKFHKARFLLDKRHLWIRSQRMQTTIRVRSEWLNAARSWLRAHKYVEVQMPTLISAAVEGGSTLFPVKYYDRDAYLTQSWQLYAEATIAALGRIYTIAPSFRAEKSRTTRHLTEYWHLEVEAPWIDLNGIMEIEEQLLSDICQRLGDAMATEFRSVGRDPDYLKRIRPPFPRITYDRAIELLQKEGGSIDWGADITWTEEKILSMKYDIPFFVTHFPKGIKAFYHMPDPKRSEVTLSADLLAPEGYGEITGGGQRIHELQELEARIREENLDPSAYQWYVELRKFGTVPHSGFGMGVERALAWMLKLKHIRDATLFPRTPSRLYP